VHQSLTHPSIFEHSALLQVHELNDQFVLVLKMLSSPKTSYKHLA
jgi:hypothetical protein